MLQLRKSIQHDGSDVNSCEDRVEYCGNLSEDLPMQNGEDAEMTQIELGNLCVSNLGMCSNIECSTFLYFCSCIHHDPFLDIYCQFKFHS